MKKNIKLVFEEFLEENSDVRYICNSENITKQTASLIRKFVVDCNPSRAYQTLPIGDETVSAYSDLKIDFLCLLSQMTNAELTQLNK